MARLQMTAAEEQALIDEIRSHIGDETYWDYENPVPICVAPELPFEVQVPTERVSALAQLANSRGMTIEELFVEAITAIDTTGFEEKPIVPPLVPNRA